jgi:hypothetical protein
VMPPTSPGRASIRRLHPRSCAADTIAPHG